MSIEVHSCCEVKLSPLHAKAFYLKLQAPTGKTVLHFAPFWSWRLHLSFTEGQIIISPRISSAMFFKASPVILLKQQACNVLQKQKDAPPSSPFKARRAFWECQKRKHQEYCILQVLVMMGITTAPVKCFLYPEEILQEIIAESYSSAVAP